MMAGARAMLRIVAAACLSCLTLGAATSSVEYTSLDGDALYEFDWAGSSSAARAEGVALRTTAEKGDDVSSLLVNELLARGFTDEVVTMATAQQERYTCVLPKSSTNDPLVMEEDEVLESKYLTPESLLQPLQLQCLKLNQGYWSYELCHGQSLRQYHEENTGKEVKVDEYLLGRLEPSWQERFGDLEREGKREDVKNREREGESTTHNKIPTWHFNGFDYPYHKVEMTGGTPCDLRGNNPRSVSVLYICQTDAHTYGTLLLVEESTSCHYVAIVGSKQLCQNQEFRLKEQPVYTISCYSEGTSPKKPGVLREQEFEILNMSPKQPSIPDTPTSDSSPVQSTAAPGPSLDDTIILTFITGEMCLRGGSGWWIHELCLMKQVKQIHQEVDHSELEVVLGVWIEEAHREWYKREGYRKKTSTSVTHLYKGGDVCDITGKRRLCYVKFKCTKKGKSASQISLYLTEKPVCVYTLTVEGQFICSLLTELDSSGLFTHTSLMPGRGSEGEIQPDKSNSHSQESDSNFNSDSQTPDSSSKLSESDSWPTDSNLKSSESDSHPPISDSHSQIPDSNSPIPDSSSQAENFRSKPVDSDSHSKESSGFDTGMESGQSQAGKTDHQAELESDKMEWESDPSASPDSRRKKSV